MGDKETEPRAPLTDTELRNMVEHIAYEVTRLYLPTRIPVPETDDPRVHFVARQMVRVRRVRTLRRGQKPSSQFLSSRNRD